MSWIISHVFIGVFDVASCTILQCYLWDLDIAKQKNLNTSHVPATLAKFLKEYTDGEVDGDKVVAERNSSVQQSEAQENLLA